MKFAAPGFGRKVLPPAAVAAGVPAAARPLVFTNGVFDVLHCGHVTCLGQARALGAALVVALNSDASVRRLGKGDDRPVNPLADRVAVIAALESVDYVTWFEEDTPLALIEAIRDISHSCYLGERKAHDWGPGCGHCPACELRADGFMRWRKATK